jgi:hypothetical protein
MVNGYALAHGSGLDAIALLLEHGKPNEIDELRGHLRIGLYRDVEVTDADRPFALVSQAFCSALPVAYSDISPRNWSRFACLVLEAAYEATLWAAVENARRGRSRTRALDKPWRRRIRKRRELDRCWLGARSGWRLDLISTSGSSAMVSHRSASCGSSNVCVTDHGARRIGPKPAAPGERAKPGKGAPQPAASFSKQVSIIRPDADRGSTQSRRTVRGVMARATGGRGRAEDF